MQKGFSPSRSRSRLQKPGPPNPEQMVQKNELRKTARAGASFDENNAMTQCELCGREVDKTTRHHLIPRTRHKKKKVQRDHAPQERLRTVDLCPPCHRQLHAVLSEKELQEGYNTLNRIRRHPEMAKFLKWIAGRKSAKRVSIRRLRQK